MPSNFVEQSSSAQAGAAVLTILGAYSKRRQGADETNQDNKADKKWIEADM